MRNKLWDHKATTSIFEVLTAVLFRSVWDKHEMSWDQGLPSSQWLCRSGLVMQTCSIQQHPAASHSCYRGWLGEQVASCFPEVLIPCCCGNCHGMYVTATKLHMSSGYISQKLLEFWLVWHLDVLSNYHCATSDLWCWNTSCHCSWCQCNRCAMTLYNHLSGCVTALTTHSWIL